MYTKTDTRNAAEAAETLAFFTSIVRTWARTKRCKLEAQGTQVQAVNSNLEGVLNLPPELESNVRPTYIFLYVPMYVQLT